MKVQIDITAADYDALLKFVQARAMGSSRGGIIGRVLLVSVCFGAAFGLAMAKTQPSGTSATPFILGLIGGVVFLYTLGLLSQRRLKRGMTPAEDGYILGPKEIELTDEGLRTTSPQAAAIFYWPAIPAPDLTKGHIFIMLDRAAGLIIPNRSFTSDAQRAAFIEELRNRAQHASP